MKTRAIFFLSLLAGAQAANIYGRQATTGSGDDDEDTAAVTSVIETADGSTTADVVTLTTEASTSEPIVDSSTDSPTDTPTDTPTDDGDTTITRTVTVTDADVATVSRSTTIMRTITSTIVVTETVFDTETVTTNGETATSVVWVTSTSWVDEKRDLSPRTVGLEEMEVDARPTATAVPDGFVAADHDHELRFARIKRGVLAKRATVTELVTVTDSNDSGTTVFASITRNVISTVTSETTSTSMVTETEVADASTTVTETSTLVVRSTRVTTGVVQTATTLPSGEYGPDATTTADSGNSSGGGSEEDGGLSTGAKAGIGAGVGVVGLAVIAGLLWFCLKKRRSEKVDHDDMFGSSEVPVGPSHRNPTPPSMSNVTPVAAAGLAPSRNPTKSSTVEGYRGTALGDGRAGYAKPNNNYPGQSTYQPVSPETQYTRTTATPNTLVSPQNDAAELNSPANTAELASDSGAARWHQSNAAEIDGNQVSTAHGSSPPAHVFEMPAQPYR